MLQRLPLPVTDVKLSPRKPAPSAAPEKPAAAPPAAKPEAKKEKAPELPPKGACLSGEPCASQAQERHQWCLLVRGCMGSLSSADVCVGCCEVIQQPAHTMPAHLAPVNIQSEAATAPLQGTCCIACRISVPLRPVCAKLNMAHLFSAAAGCADTICSNAGCAGR